jgi:hypothetical protein
LPWGNPFEKSWLDIEAYQDILHLAFDRPGKPGPRFHHTEFVLCLEEFGVPVENSEIVTHFDNGLGIRRPKIRFIDVNDLEEIP